MLIGTSGSGKSTTLKMINRLVEHDSGRIRFAGEEIRNFDAKALRRRMGYAVSPSACFPLGVAQNIATVPQLLKWLKARINARIDELLDLLVWMPRNSVTATRISFPVGNSSVLAWHAHWPPTRKCC